MVRAKFKCNSVEENIYDKVAKLESVHSTDGENKDFSSATPCGNLEIHISKDVPASNFFNPGKEYYLDFTEAK